MEAIKKKMALLRDQLASAEERAEKAEQELKEANERAQAVSIFHPFSELFLTNSPQLSWCN